MYILKVFVLFLYIDPQKKRWLNSPMKTNYHTHCNYCDGKGELKEYVLEAINRGFTSLGFSSHAPLKEDSDWTMRESDLNSYLKKVEELKEEFKGKINIYLGMEIDYYPDEDRFKYYSKCNLDFSIGAVHLLYKEDRDDYFSVDCSPKDFEYVMNDIYGSAEAFGRAYFKAVRDLIVQGGFNLLAHLDLFKKYNRGDRFFSENEEWYKKEVLSTLDLLSTTDIIIEVNTGAMARGVQNTPYPSLWILKECNKRNIKICLNSDSHSPDKLDFYFTEALELIKSAGYRELNTPFEVISIV